LLQNDVGLSNFVLCIYFLPFILAVARTQTFSQGAVAYNAPKKWSKDKMDMRCV
jgi:hypothetical protein